MLWQRWGWDRVRNEHQVLRSLVKFAGTGKPCDLICAYSSGPLQSAEVCAIKRFSVCCHFSCGTQRVLKFLLALISTMQHPSEPVKPCDLICACSSGPLQGAEVCAIKRLSVCIDLDNATSL